MRHWTINEDVKKKNFEDSAFMRFVGPPGHEGREKILRIRTRRVSIEPAFYFTKIASMVRMMHQGRVFLANITHTDGCSGAEISALLRTCVVDHAKRH